MRPLNRLEMTRSSRVRCALVSSPYVWVGKGGKSTSDGECPSCYAPPCFNGKVMPMGLAPPSVNGIVVNSMQSSTTRVVRLTTSAAHQGWPGASAAARDVGGLNVLPW